MPLMSFQEGTTLLGIWRTFVRVQPGVNPGFSHVQALQKTQGTGRLQTDVVIGLSMVSTVLGGYYTFDAEAIECASLGASY